MPLPTLQTLNIAQPQPATMKLQAMQMQDKTKRTDLYGKQVGISRDRFGLEKETLEFNKKQKKLEIGKQFIPSLTKEEYPKFREWIKSIDKDWVELLPEEAPENFDDLKKQIYLGADNLTKVNLSQYKAYMNQAKETKKQEAATALQSQKDDAAMKRTKVTAGAKETKEEKRKQKRLDGLSSDYYQQVGRGYSAERGTGQFIPDENKAAVAGKAYDSSMIIAQQYVNEGGKWEDLGLEDPSKAPEAKDGDFVAQLNESHPPAKFKGKTGTDTDTGKKYKSDGKNWIEIK